MGGIVDRIRTLGRELERRRVYRAGAIYVALAAGTLSGADILIEALLLEEDWILPLLFVVAVTGFPIVLVLAWLYDFTRGGLKRAEADVGGLRWAFATFVVLLSVGLGGAAWWLWLGPVATVGVVRASDAASPELDPARVAVLYLDDHSADGSLSAIANGFTEELTHRLARVEGLEVVSRNGVKVFRGRDVPFDSIVEAFSAGSIVEGSVQASGDSLRVTVQLIDGATATHLTSATVDRPRGELFKLLDEVSGELVGVLRSEIGSEIRVRELRSRASSNQAWLLTHRAQQLYEDEFEEYRTADAPGALLILDRADSLLTRAAELDPEWADPWVKRGAVHLTRARLETDSPGLLDPEWARLAMEFAESALERDPALPRALELRGTIRAGLAHAEQPPEAGRLRAQAVEDLRRAIEVDPGAGGAWWQLSQVLLERGLFAEARRAARRALDVDAFLEVNRQAMFSLFEAAVNLEEMEEARFWCDEGRRRFPDFGNFVLCRLMIMASDTALTPDPRVAWRAVDTLGEVVAAQLRGPMTRIGRANVAKVLARAGLPDSARTVLSRVEGEGQLPSWLAYDAAHAHLMLGDRERALELLGSYVSYQPGRLEILANDWWFRPLWSDPRFQALVGAEPAG